MAASEETVDIFDETTWGDERYDGILSLVHCMVVIHPTQNQRVESHVQAAAIVRKTNVKEARATARVRIHSFLVRRHNEESISAKKANITDAAKRKKIDLSCTAVCMEHQHL